MSNASDENRPGPPDTPGRSPIEGHEPWCNRQEHALVQADGFPDAGCVGSTIEDGGVGGWLVVDDGTRLVIDWRSMGSLADPLTLNEAAHLLGFLGRALAQAGAR